MGELSTEPVLPELPKPKATGIGDEYDAFDSDGKPMGKAYANIDYFTADQMLTMRQSAIAYGRALERADILKRLGEG
jgi:hypothetical protein